MSRDQRLTNKLAASINPIAMSVSNFGSGSGGGLSQ